MAPACKFCFYLNSYVCGEPEDCMGCGKCKQSKEAKENGATTAQ